MTTDSPTPVTPGPIKLAVIPGDGIGPEVTAEALKVLEVAAPAGGEVRADPLRPRRRALPRDRRGAARLRARARSASTTRSCSARSAASPTTRTCRPGILERGLLLRLRFELDHYVNLRPSRIFPGVDLAAGRPWRGRLRRRPRGHRGSLHRQRRRAPGRHAGRDRHRGLGQHRVRRRAGRPRRLRPRPAPAAQEAHPGPQDQRAGQRRLALVAARPGGRRRSSPTSPSTTSTSTRR